MQLSKKNQRGELYVDGIDVKSGQSSGREIYIDSLKRLFLGGVPENFDARQVPVSRFAASLFDARCRSVEPIAGGGGVLNPSIGVFMIPDEFRPSLMFYTAISLSFSSAFLYARSHFRYSHVLFDGLRKKDRLLVVY